MALSNRGFSSLETMVAIVAVAAVVSILLFVAYLSFTKVWVQHQSHEALLCMAKGHSTVQCELQMKKGLGVLGPIFKPSLLTKVNRERGQYQLQVQYKIHNWKFSSIHKLTERSLWSRN